VATAPDQDVAERLLRLRTTDLDRYLACLLMPASVRDDLVRLFLFNAEIAAVRDKVRAALPGEVRLQWWVDALSGERAGEARDNPVASTFLEMLDRRAIPVVSLISMCQARVFDLYDDPMPDRATYEGYAGETAAALLQISALVLDPAHATAAATVCGHAGVAQSVAGHLMLLPLHRSRGQVYLPGDSLAATGLDRDGFLAGDDDGRCAAAISAFVSLGREHLFKARAEMARLPPTLRPALLPVALSAPVFDLADRLGARCLEQSPQPAQWRRQWRFFRARATGRI